MANSAPGLAWQAAGHGELRVGPRLSACDQTVIAEARAAGRLWHIDTGHDLMVTEPAFVADALQQIAAG